MKFRHLITLTAQTLVAFSALTGSAMSLAWLEQKNSAIPSPALPRWNDTAPLILVDAGHGGHDGGAVSHDIIEKNLALDIARRLQVELEAMGMRVHLTRSKDVFLTLEERAALTEKHAATAFVSVHLNTDGDGGDAEGIETYFADTSKAPLSSRQLSPTLPASSADFATLVQRSVCAITKAQNRGTKARSYAVVAQARCPAVLVECGFITSPAESTRLKREAYRDQVASGIAQGVSLFIQTQPSAPPPVVTAAK